MKMPTRLGLLLIVPALGIFACGKDDNLHEPALVEFPHSFPEAPRPLRNPQALPWTAGHALAVTADDVFLVDRDNRELVQLDRKTLDRKASVALGGKPEQLVVADDGAIFISLRNGEVVKASSQSGSLQIEQRVRLGSEVYGIALSPDGTTLYATLPQERELYTLDATDLAEVATPVPLLDTPRGVSVSPNHWLMVVHQFDAALPIELDQYNLPINDKGGSALRIANPADHLDGFRLRGLHAARALATVMSPEPEHGGAFIGHITASPGTAEDFLNSTMNAPVASDSSMSSDGYGGSSPSSATFPVPTRPVEVTVTATDSQGKTMPAELSFPVQDTVSGEPLTHLVDQPTDVAHHPSWSLLFMTGYGSDNVLVLSTAEGDPARSPVAIIEVGKAPRGIAFSPDGEQAYVLNEHDLTVSVIDLTPFFALETMADGRPVTATIDTDGSMSVPMAGASSRDMGMMDPSMATDNSAAMAIDPTDGSPRVRPFRMKATMKGAYGVDPRPESVRRGARAFTFARNANLSHAGEFSCGTCHFEGTEDKLVWFISDGPRQTPALAGRLLGTAPFNWAGSKDGLAENMVQTVDRMGGKGLTKQELADLEQFLLYGLEAPANPNIAPDGQLTVEQLEGKMLFEDKAQGCGGCHRSEQNFTDGLLHDVGTASKVEVTRFEFDRAQNPEAIAPWVLNTPSLKGLFYTAPYLHDGSEATLLGVLERTGETMGKTSHLTPEQKQKLVAYLLTL